MHGRRISCAVEPLPPPRYGPRVGATYTSGTWRVKPGEEDEFVAAWEAFVTWAAQMPGSGTFHLVRDIDDRSHYMSFGDWDSFSA